MEEMNTLFYTCYRNAWLCR